MNDDSILWQTSAFINLFMPVQEWDGIPVLRGCERLLLAPGEDAACGVVAGGAGNASARMRSGAAQPQPGEGCAVTSEARHRPHEKKLLEVYIAVKDVSLRDAEGLLKVERRQHLAGDDRGWDVRRVTPDYFHDPVAQVFAHGARKWGKPSVEVEQQLDAPADREDTARNR